MLRTGDISAQPWFKPAIAAWFAVLFGGGTLAILVSIPREALEWQLGAIGLADLHPAFAAPVGGAGLVPIAGLAALIGLGLGFYLAERVVRSQQPKSSPKSEAPWKEEPKAPEPKVTAEEPGKIRVLSALDDIDEEGIPPPKSDDTANIWLPGSEFDPDPDVEAEIEALSTPHAEAEGKGEPGIQPEIETIPAFLTKSESPEEIEPNLDSQTSQQEPEQQEEVEIENVERPPQRTPHFSDWQEVGAPRSTPKPEAPATLEATPPAPAAPQLATRQPAMPQPAETEQAIRQASEPDIAPFYRQAPPEGPASERAAPVPKMYEPEIDETEPEPDIVLRAPEPQPLPPLERETEPEPEPEPEPAIVLTPPEPAPETETETEIILEAPEPIMAPAPTPAPVPDSTPAPTPKPAPAPDPADMSLEALTSRLGRAMNSHGQSRNTSSASGHDAARESAPPSAAAPQADNSQDVLRHALEKLGNAGKRR